MDFIGIDLLDNKVYEGNADSLYCHRLKSVSHVCTCTLNKALTVLAFLVLGQQIVDAWHASRSLNRCVQERAIDARSTPAELFMVQDASLA